MTASDQVVTHPNAIHTVDEATYRHGVYSGTLHTLPPNPRSGLPRNALGNERSADFTVIDYSKALLKVKALAKCIKSPSTSSAVVGVQ